jgi:hypothetical protein
MASLPLLIGNWHFVNSSSTSIISGKMRFSSNGDANMTVPSPMFGNYFLEWSCGYIGTSHHILTFCNAENCENSTLITASPNYIKFIDNQW